MTEITIDGAATTEDELTNMFNEAYKRLLSKLAAEHKELGKKVVGKEQKNRNFKIHVYMSQKGHTQICIVHKETGKEVSLNSYLLPRWRFIPSDKFVCNYRKRQILFNSEDVRNRGFLLSLMHEIGHSRRFFHPTKNIASGLWFLIKMIVRFISHFRFEKIRDPEENKTTIKIVTPEPEEVYYPFRYKDVGGYNSALSERESWAYSLKQLRKLKRRGYNVFEGYVSASHIHYYIAYCLITYDYDYFVENMSKGKYEFIQNDRSRVWFWKPGHKGYKEALSIVWSVSEG